MCVKGKLCSKGKKNNGNLAGADSLFVFLCVTVRNFYN